MNCKLEGYIYFANKRPAPNVIVRVFDKDAPNKKDDDLTLEVGVSDENGHFIVSFSPSRFLDMEEVEIKRPEFLPFDWIPEKITWNLPDPLDFYQPYLHFSYTHNNQSRTHVTALLPFKRHFRLPQMPAITFQPTMHGFKFVNRFRGYFLPFSIPSIPDIPSVNNIYGLCGGMVAAALDIAATGGTMTDSRKPPGRRSKLHRYLYRRQIDSFGSFGAQIVRFARWMFLPNDSAFGTMRKSLTEYEKIRSMLKDNNPLPIGLVYVRARDTLEIWQNHQVLAYAYTRVNKREIIVHIYDPNYPLRDDVQIRCKVVPIERNDPELPVLFGLKSEQWVGKQMLKPVRGFFAMPYVPVEPPKDL